MSESPGLRLIHAEIACLQRMWQSPGYTVEQRSLMISRMMSLQELEREYGTDEPQRDA